MHHPNRLKQRLRAGETLAAAWAGLGSPDAAEVLVHAGWDVIVIDCEHGAASVDDAIPLIRAVEGAGASAVLRVPDGSDTVLKRALDRGAQSLLVPMVSTAEQARAVAASCLYPPRGHRGYAAPLTRASGYGTDSAYARRHAHDDLLLMVQIEHIDAIDAIPEIATIPGIDMVFVGPHDLAGSMNLLEQLDHPDLLAAARRIEALAKASGLMLGTIRWPTRPLSDLRADGYQLIGSAFDVALLSAGARAARDAADQDLAHTSA